MSSLSTRHRDQAGQRAWAPAALVVLTALLASTLACARPPAVPEPVEVRWHRCVPDDEVIVDLLQRNPQGPRLAGNLRFQLTSVSEANELLRGEPGVERGELVGDAVALPMRGGDGVESGGERWRERWRGKALRAILDCPRDEKMTFELAARIVDAHPDRDRGVWKYRVEILPPVPEKPHGRGGFIPLYEGKDVIVLPGSWDRNGAYRDEKGFVSFASDDMAAAECANFHWRYSPRDVGRKPHVAELYQACMRMATADYCGDRHSSTRKGTKVNVWDSASVEVPSPAVPGERFEAAWTPNGALCLDHPRWPDLFFNKGTRTPRRGCFSKIPTCHTAEEAQRLVPPGTALLFNSSCTQEKCSYGSN